MKDKECRKCGISLEYNNHSESECDFIPIDYDKIDELIYVEDITPKVTVKGGYGIWELVLIYDIMKKLWVESDNKTYQSLLCSDLNLFYEAEKIYKSRTKIY